MDALEVLRNRAQCNNRHWNKPDMDQTEGADLKALLPIGDAFDSRGSVRTVNARALHAALGVGRDFSNWIKGRINGYGFRRGVDYTTLAKTGEPGFQQAIEYHVTLDMAKELGMLEKTLAGQRVRRYFIDAERQLRGVQAPTTLEGALELALKTERARLLLETEVEQLKPKAAFADAVASTDDTMSMAEAAQKLGTGQNRLFRALRAADVLIKHGQRYNLPYQYHVEARHFVVAVGTHERPDGLHSHSSVQVTPKGLQYLHKIIGKDAN